MPAPLKKSEVDRETDPSVAKQYDTTTPKDKQIADFYETVDGLGIGLLTTLRPGVGPVSRCMAVAKRVGPDFLFLANINSNKFSDIDSDAAAQVTFRNSSTNDWVSVSGRVVTASNEDKRIKELFNPSVKAWFGDLGDGKHNGTPDDPRMALVEVKATYITYWLHTVGDEEFKKEVGEAQETGQVAQTGLTRELKSEDVEKMRKEA